MSKYYDIGYIGELPLTELPGLISYAEKQEAVEQTRGLYLASYMLAKMNGTDPIGYDEFLRQVLAEGEQEGATPRDPEQIDNEMSKIVAAYTAHTRKEA